MRKKTISTQRKYNKYIPTLLHQTIELSDYPRKDNLYVILDKIYSKDYFIKSRAQREYTYTAIPKSEFQKYIAKTDYLNDALNFLIENKFIIRNDWYDYKAGKCKGYKIASEYLGDRTKVTIQNDNINKRIEAEMEEIKNRKVKNLDFEKSEYYKTFKIDAPAASKYVYNLITSEIKSLSIKLNIKLNKTQIDELVTCTGNYVFLKNLILKNDTENEFLNLMHRFCVYNSQIDKINEGYLYFKRNDSNGRLDTNLTSLPSFLRPFIQNDKELYSIDLKNSQPFFLYTAIKDVEEIDIDEKEFYKNLVVSGDTSEGLYEFLATEWEKEGKGVTNRKQIKTLLFQIFYSKPKSFKPKKDFFGKLFPTILKWINKQKENNYKDFAIMLQTIESNIVLDVIMPQLRAKGITPYTIHDSFVCAEDEVLDIKQIIIDTCQAEYGVNPNMHIDSLTGAEVLSPEVEDFDDYEFDFMAELTTEVTTTLLTQYSNEEILKQLK